MKILKFVFLSIFFILFFSCSDESIQVDATNESVGSVEVEVRSFCAGTECGDLTDILNTFTSNNLTSFPSPNGTSNMWDDWRRVFCALQACDIPIPSDCGDFQGHGTDCSRIGVPGKDDPNNVGLPCPDFVNMSYCRLDCYIRNYVTNPTEVGLINVKVAFCDYLLSLNNCLDTGFNLDDFCGL